MAISVTTRAGKGAPLNATEHDANINNIVAAIENTTSGHDHDGANSKKITYSSITAMTSAQLAGIISDETGSGALVFAESPTLVTPTLGVATATSINLGYTTITSSGTAGNYTTYFLNASSGEVILTLPAAATYAGRIYHIVRVQTYPSAYNCIVACQSGEYINGEASLALENNYDRVTAQSNGTGWIILGR